MASLSAEEQLRLADAYFRGVSLAALSAEFGLSPAQIQAIIMKTHGRISRSIRR